MDDAQDPMRYALVHQVEIKGKAGDVLDVVREVALRRLTGADMAVIGNAKAKGEGEVMRVMVCRVASLPPSTFDLMDAEDVMALSERAADFMGGALSTGGR